MLGWSFYIKEHRHVAALPWGMYHTRGLALSCSAGRAGISAIKYLSSRNKAADTSAAHAQHVGRLSWELRRLFVAETPQVSRSKAQAYLIIQESPWDRAVWHCTLMEHYEPCQQDILTDVSLDANPQGHAEILVQTASFTYSS